MFILLLQSLQFWPVELLLLDLMSLSHIRIVVGCFVLGRFFEQFLTFWQQEILQAPLEPALESVISLSTGSFYWRMVLATETWVLGVLVAPGVLLPLIPALLPLALSSDSLGPLGTQTFQDTPPHHPSLL